MPSGSRRPAGGGGLRSSLLALGGIFLVGGLFVAGLFLTAWEDVAPEYRSSVVGVPPTTLRVLSWNLDWNSSRLSAAIAELDRLNGDYLILQRVSRGDAQAIASGLNMRYRGELQMYYSPDNPGTTLEPGNAILSRHPLYRGRSMRPVGGGGYGILVDSVIDGRRFVVGCVDLTTAARNPSARAAELAAITTDWEKAGKPPTIIGGDFGSTDSSQGVAVTGFFDTAAGLHQAGRLFVSSEWRATDAATGVEIGLPHRPIWTDVGDAHPSMTGNATSRP